MDKGRFALIAGMFIGMIIGRILFDILEYAVKLLFNNALIQVIAYMIGVIIIFALFILFLKLVRYVIENKL